ncbi:hypothetical protein C6A85_000000107915, partial [Mycobacterium sp. ITM-2017-0098]
MSGSQKATKLSIRQLIWVCLGMISVVFVVCMSIFLSARFAVADAVGELSGRTLPAQDNVSSLSTAYVDQETGQRGFLLTGNPSFLDPYFEGQDTADRLVAELRTNLAGDVEGTQRLNAVADAAAEWTAQAGDPQIAVRRAGPLTQAQALEMTASGKRLFDALRTQLSALQDRTGQLIDAQLAQVKTAQLIANISQGVGSVLLLGVVSAAVWMSRRLLTRPVNSVLEDVTAVAEGAYDRPIRRMGPREIAVLAEAAETMRANLHVTNESLAGQAAISDKARRAKEIQANLMTEVQGVADLAAAGSVIVSGAAQAVDAKHGALYLQEPDEPGRYALTSSYAFHRRKGLPNSYGLGDGLIGQCALEGNRIEVTGAPGDYVEIVSGLGKTEPVSLILIPIKFESEVLGVLELAGLRLFSDDDIELLESIALGAGVAISAVESAQKTRELLRVSQAQTEELQTQEEELRAANEQLIQREDQLSAQNAELEETTEELRSQREELRASSERLESQAQSLEQKNDELQRLSDSLEIKAEELAVSSRYKSEFLANMSHELRTPLNSVLILAGLLTEADDLDDKQHEFAETIQQSGKDLLNLIDEVLDLAKVESGSLYFEKESIEVGELVSFLDRTFGPIAEDKDVDFRVDVDSTAPQGFTSDYTRVKQIAKNLVANAIKFTDQGAVTVRIS